MGDYQGTIMEPTISDPDHQKTMGTMCKDFSTSVNCTFADPKDQQFISV